jgi:hypothetical protein
MSGLKTFLAVLFMLVGALPAPALNNSANDDLRIFAICAGRFSAQMEHSWLFGKSDAGELEQDREMMLLLIDAIMPDTDRVRVLDWRINAKQAHAMLLTRAAYTSDDGDADWAKSRAAAAIAECRDLLLFN